VVLGEDHRRAAGPVVVQLVGVEHGHDGGAVAQQVLARQPLRAAGVDEAVERLHEHRTAQPGQLGVGQLEQRAGVEHGGASSE
jgi:hypothetical protein